MAQYQDFNPPPNATPADIYNQIANLMGTAYSVEVIPQGATDTVVLRVWFTAPYDIAQHQKIT